MYSSYYVSYCRRVTGHFDDIDILITYGKKILLKSPLRIDGYKESYPELILFPYHIYVITRWATWLEATNYFGKFFDEFKDDIEKLDEKQSKSIQNIRKIVNSHCTNTFNR